jgi:AAA+ superfamily predicted ATPase
MERDSGGFELELERVRVRALRAYAAAAGASDDAAQLEARLAEIGGELAEAAPRDRGLAGLLGLGPDELGLVWVVVAATADPAIAPLLGNLGPRAGRVGISLVQAVAILGLKPARARALGGAIGADRPLMALGLLEAAIDGAVTAETALVASLRLRGFLAGSDELDLGLRHAGGLVELPATVISDDDRDRLRRQVRELVRGEKRPVIVIEGHRGNGRRTLAREAAEQAIVELDLDRIGRSARALDGALVALGRECLLRGALPLVHGVEQLAGNEADAVGRRHALVAFIEQSPTPVVVVASGDAPPLETSRPVVRLAMPRPSPRTRAAIWRQAIGGPAGDEPLAGAIERAALRFQLGPGGILAATSAARALAAARDAALSADDLADGVRTTVEERLRGLARRHVTALGWDDLIVADETRQQLDLLLTRVRHGYQVLEDWGFRRHLAGTGVAALFSGPPGTGKTMVASLLARELGLELYRVDLSQITSKWIGETEKQLDAVFTAAEVGHVVLLFDEADALFAKRTEVKGATERYANLEVNFLLQRIESFGGVAILTTNMEGSLDAALRRRLAAHIQFPHPDEDERAALWRRLVPAAAPLDPGVAFDELAAEYPDFAGAHIRNALTTAAFMAAAAGSRITRAVLHAAATEEARAMGRMMRAGGRS